jgi:hypothetical protein
MDQGFFEANTTQLSDLMYTVSNIPHLRTTQLAVEYRELLESEAQSMQWGWGTCQKWKQDPDAARSTLQILCQRNTGG